jgi:hypothetical protein
VALAPRAQICRQVDRLAIGIRLAIEIRQLARAAEYERRAVRRLETMP